MYAECVADAESEAGHYCECKPGFEGDGAECRDLDECEEGATYCAPLADCRNHLGHYECVCAAPKVGDGRTCQWAEEPLGDAEETREDAGGRGEVPVVREPTGKCVFLARPTLLFRAVKLYFI